jgi:hypothetical protein
MDSSEVDNTAAALGILLFMLSIEMTGPIWQKFRTNSAQDISFVLQTHGSTTTKVKLGFVTDKDYVMCVCLPLTSRPCSAQVPIER